MNKALMRGGFGFLLCLATAGAAFAAITFNPDDGTGFVGKGDVQEAFGWNNHALQANASGISFTFEVTARFEAVCEWTTGEGRRGEKVHQVTHKRKGSVARTISYDARTRKQVTGFILTGYDDVSGSGDDVPEVGGPCPGNQGHEGVWVSVEILEQGTGGGLYVHHGDQSVLLQ